MNSYDITAKAESLQRPIPNAVRRILHQLVSALATPLLGDQRTRSQTERHGTIRRQNRSL